MGSKNCFPVWKEKLEPQNRKKLQHMPYFTCHLHLKNYFSLESHAKPFKIHGFRNPLLKNHGFHGTHGTHANAIPVGVIEFFLNFQDFWNLVTVY